MGQPRRQFGSVVECDLDAAVLQRLGLVCSEEVFVNEAVVVAVRGMPVDVLRDGLHESPLGVADVVEVVDHPCVGNTFALVLGDGQAARAVALLDLGQRDEPLHHLVEICGVDVLVDERVAHGLEAVEVLVGDAKHVARIARLLSDRCGVLPLPLVLRAAKAPLQGVLADDADRGGVDADGRVAVVAVDEADERVDPLVLVAADQDVPVEAGECPDLAAVVEAAGGVVVGVAASDDLIEEVERLVVLHDGVLGADDAERLHGVHADGREAVGDVDVDHVPLAVVRGASDGADEGVQFDVPVEAGEAHSLVRHNGVLFDDGAEAMPCRLSSAVEGVVVLHDAVAHAVPFGWCSYTVA